MVHTRVPIALCFLISSVAPGADDHATEALRELFKQKNPPAATRQLQAVLSACDNDPVRLKALIAPDTAYETFEPGWLRRVVEVRDGEKYDTEFHVRVPKGYTPTRSYPVLLAAHGQGGDGKSIAQFMANLLGEDVGKYILLAPTMPGPKVYSGRPYQEQAYLLPLLWTKRNLNVDDDRVVISGYSQGGHVAWHMATMFPQMFSAALPMAGKPWFQGSPYTHDMYLVNLRHLPVWAIWGEKDAATPPKLGNVSFCRSVARRLKDLGNKHFKGTELEGVGHVGCWPEPRQFAEFVSAHRRKVVPTELEHRFHLVTHARSYYIETVEPAHKPLDFTKRLEIRIVTDKQPTKEEQREAFRKYIEKSAFRMRAWLDKPNNAFKLRARAIRRIRLHVVEGMFDLDKPVRIEYWSRKRTVNIPISAECILTHYAAERDQRALIVNEIDLDIRGTLVQRYPSGKSAGREND